MGVNRLKYSQWLEQGLARQENLEKAHERAVERAKREAIQNLEAEKGWIQQLAHRVKQYFKEKRLEEERQKQRRFRMSEKRKRDLQIIERARKRGVKI